MQIGVLGGTGPAGSGLAARLAGRIALSAGCAVEGDRVFSLERWGHHDQAVLVVRSALQNAASIGGVHPMP